jgi:mRNA interferase MazF
VRRGEVWWADLPAPIGSRPVVLVSRQDAYDVRDFLLVVPVTTRVRQIPAEVALGASQGVRTGSVANCDAVQQVPKTSLKRQAGALTGSTLHELDTALRYALGLGD